MSTRDPLVDEGFMREALVLAQQGEGRVAPNPLVGAVIVRDGEIVGRGFHVFAERDHAEVRALHEAGERARGATVYVTLEPCSSLGRTPPCTTALLEAGVARVVAAMVDPDERHRGRGLRALREAGVATEAGLLLDEAARQNEAWLHRTETGRARVLLKLAQSLDGRIAPASGNARWITGEPARALVQGLRRRADAVLVGVGTIVEDDPRLTVRLQAGTAPGITGPWRCILDPSLRCPPHARVLKLPAAGEAARGTLVLTRESLLGRLEGQRRAQALREAGAEIVGLEATDSRLDPALVALELAKRGVDALLVEGGARTAGAFVRARVVDRLIVHVAPMVLGDEETVPAIAGWGASEIEDAPRFVLDTVGTAGGDVVLELLTPAWAERLASLHRLCDEHGGT